MKGDRNRISAFFLEANALDELGFIVETNHKGILLAYQR
jgi:hypothetical protein